MKVIFDTNAYRNFASNKTSDECLSEIEQIKTKQLIKGVESFASTVVAEELLCHIYDNEAFYPEGDCTKAIRTLYAHCGDDNSYCAVPKPEAQIARDLFGVSDDRAISTQKAVMEICYAVYKTPTEAEIVKYRSAIQEIKRHNEDVEHEVGEFFDNLAVVWRENDKSDMEKADIVKDMSALAFVVSVAEKKGDPVSDDYALMRRIYQKQIAIYKEQYAAPLKMRENFVKKLCNPRFKPKKPERVNMVWDSLILHYSHQTIDGDPVVIVTGDAAMIEAARQTASGEPSTPFQGNVATLAEYLDWLNS